MRGRNSIFDDKSAFHFNKEISELSFSLPTGDPPQKVLQILDQNTFLIFYVQFFKFVSFFMLVPFTIHQDNSGNYFLKNVSIFRKTLSLVLYVAVFITSILQLRRASAISIKQKPELIFTLADFFCWAVYVLIFFHTFWRRKDLVKDVISLPMGNPSRKVKLFGVFLCCIPVCQILYYKFWLEMFSEQENFEAFAKEYRRKVLYAWFIQRNITSEPDWSFSLREIDALCVINFILEMLYGWIVTYFEMFALISALCSYKYSLQLPTKKSAFVSIQILEMYYSDLAIVFERINDLTTNFMLWTYIQVIPWVAGSFVDVIDAEKWGFILFMWGYYISYAIILTLSSEVHYKVNQFELFLKKRQSENCKTFFSATSLKMSAVDGDTIGLRGGRFFTMSYSFLGATVSVLITYVIIVLQFQSSPPKPFN